MDCDSSFNLNYVDLLDNGDDDDANGVFANGDAARVSSLARLKSSGDTTTKALDITSSQAGGAEMAVNTDIYNDRNKFNSFPMRQKKANVKIKINSASVAYKDDVTTTMPPLSLSLTSYMTQGELSRVVHAAQLRSADRERLKQLMRNNNWTSRHPIRKYLWSTLLQLAPPGAASSSLAATNTSSSSTSSHQHQHPASAPSTPTNNKENELAGISGAGSGSGAHRFYANEIDYNKDLNHIFGKSRENEVTLPAFAANINTDTTPVMLNQLCHSPSPHSHNKSHDDNNRHHHQQAIVNGTGTVSTHLNYYYLNEKGKQAIKRILCVYELNYPHVVFNPGLVSISSILLHYMQEHEVFAALCYMTATKEHFIESKANWDATCYVFARLLKNFCKSSYDMVAKYAVDSLEVIFNEWYWWIFDCLSFEYLIKIVDCYLYEGQKVLYRVGLAIVQQFSKHMEMIEDCRYLNELFSDGKTQKIFRVENMAVSQSLRVNKDSIKNFCRSSSSIESIDKLLKASFNIRNLKRSTIRDLFIKESKRRQLGDSLLASSSPLRTLSIPSDESYPPNHSPTRVFLDETSTSILSHANLSTIWNWIPQRLTLYRPTTLFTTQENGTSLNTLYNVLDELEYCLLVIRTFDNEIFGAFCSGLWQERKNPKVLYFGNGETFLFTLTPDKRTYKWIGLRKPSVTSSEEMFLRADSKKITIGGGGSSGLTINGNLLEGTTARCETFGNDPLSVNAAFQIAILEVVGFDIK